MNAKKKSTLSLDEIIRLYDERTGASTRRSHAHMNIDDIKSTLNIGKVEYLFLWLAKTDLYVLSACTFNARKTLQSLGFMVAFTSLLAFASAFYTIMTTILPDPEIARQIAVAAGTPEAADPGMPILRWVIGLALALIYAFGIMTIDREIVASKGGWSPTLIRLVFAGFIATAVSYPVKLKIFEGEITAQIAAGVDEKHKDALEVLRSPNKEERSKTISDLELERGPKFESMREYQRGEEQERKNQYCGDRCMEFRGLKQQEQNKITEINSKIERLRSNELNDDEKSRLRKLEAQIATEKSNRDLLTQWNAIDRIKKTSSSDYERLAFFILFFFIALELVPVLLKWSLGKSEYNYYIIARDQVNAQKIISVANLFIDIMKDDPRNALKVPDEITDLFHYNMEDEAMAPEHGTISRPPEPPSQPEAKNKVPEPPMAKPEGAERSIDTPPELKGDIDAAQTPPAGTTRINPEH